MMLVCLLMTGCETLDSTEPSPLFDQALMMNGHYSLVYPDRH
jgi:hypothetical protein